MTSPAAILYATSGARNRTRPPYSTASSATRSRGKRLMALAREVLDALGLQAAEDLAGAVGDLAREAGEAGDVDAAGGGLGALLDAMRSEEHTSELQSRQ